MLKYLFGDKLWCFGMFLEKMDGMQAIQFVLLYGLMLISIMAIAYLCGSVNTAVILSKLMYHEDIRTKGSGNAGMTNMMRTYGKGPAALTLLGDMLKAMLGMIAGTLILGVTGAYVAGLFCVLGHIAPVFYKFKGGKGVASTAMVVLYIDWRVFLILLLFFVLVVWGTKYLSMGSVTCMLFMPLLLNRTDLIVYYPYVPTDSGLRLIISLVIAGLVIFMHRSNISRVRAGTESKFRFKKTVKRTDESEDSSSNDNRESESDNKKRKK